MVETTELYCYPWCMKLLKLIASILIIIPASAFAQQLIPIGDTGVLCVVVDSGENRLAQMKLNGYDTVSKQSVIQIINRKIQKKKAKKESLAAALSEATGAQRQRIKNKLDAVKTQIANLKLEKDRINDCLDGIGFPPGFSPIKYAALQNSPNHWSAYAYIDPPPIRKNLPGGGYALYGSYDSLWCLTYSGAFSDSTKPPWTEGTEFSAYKSLDLCDPDINVAAGACKDRYGTNNAGIAVALKTGATEEEARANVSNFIGGVISYFARIQRASTCAGDRSTL